MAAIKRILVPTDFSKTSQAAEEQAAELASTLGAELTLLHVYEPIAWPLPEGYVLYSPEQLTELLTEADRLLAQAKARLEARGVKQVSVKRLQGIIAPEIVDEAERGKHDLVVIGTHGRTGIAHAVMGSIAEKVLRTARCPVLSVRTP